MMKLLIISENTMVIPPSCSVFWHTHPLQTQADGQLFCGDAAMNGLPSLHRITIWVEDKTAFLKSWETIIAFRPKIIYPGHGKPFEYGELIANMNRAKNMKLLPLS